MKRFAVGVAVVAVLVAFASVLVGHIRGEAGEGVLAGQLPVPASMTPYAAADRACLNNPDASTCNLNTITYVTSEKPYAAQRSWVAALRPSSTDVKAGKCAKTATRCGAAAQRDSVQVLMTLHRDQATSTTRVEVFVADPRVKI